MKTIFALLSVVVASTAVAAPQQPAAMPANHPAMESPANAPTPNQGKVVEILDTAMYTYVQVESKGTKTWLAAGRFKVAKGDMVSYSSGPVMEKFHSKTLNRDFDAIMFVDKAVVAKK